MCTICNVLALKKSQPENDVRKYKKEEIKALFILHVTSFTYAVGQLQTR